MAAKSLLLSLPAGFHQFSLREERGLPWTAPGAGFGAPLLGIHEPAGHKPRLPVCLLTSSLTLSPVYRPVGKRRRLSLAAAAFLLLLCVGRRRGKRSDFCCIDHHGKMARWLFRQIPASLALLPVAADTPAVLLCCPAELSDLPLPHHHSIQPPFALRAWQTTRGRRNSPSSLLPSSTVTQSLQAPVQVACRVRSSLSERCC